MTITEFLLARIAEDEAVARAAIDPDQLGTHWHWVTTETDTVVASGDLELAQLEQRVSLRTIEEFDGLAGLLPVFLIGCAEEVDPGVGEHTARHDPPRVLAECEAKRRIVALHPCDDCGAGDDPCATLRVLASVYADHPDYRDEWTVA